MAAAPRKQVHLGAYFPGVNHFTVWSDPRSGSQISIDSFLHYARTAERGRFDFFFQAEGLRVRERRGRFYENDVAGRPDILTLQAALAGATTHLGLLSTVNATFNEPYELARKLASLDHLSAGRAGWNIVTTSDAFHGANFRRGGYLRREDRYVRAAEVAATALELWDSWADGAGEFAHRGTHVDVEGVFPVPTPPQHHPVLFQAGDSGEGRDFAVRTVDAVFTAWRGAEAGRAFVADLHARARRAGRDPRTLRVLPGLTVVLGDTPAEAEANARAVERAQVTPATALVLLEQVWRRDLSSFDPDGPPPEPREDLVDEDLTAGRTTQSADLLAQAREWYAHATEAGLSIRELVLARANRTAVVGTPGQVADQIDEAVQTDAADGFIISPTIVPHGLDEFVDRVVPLLQERGSLRTEYPQGATFRDLLGLPPHAPGAAPGVAPFSVADSEPTAPERRAG